MLSDINMKGGGGEGAQKSSGLSRNKKLENA